MNLRSYAFLLCGLLLLGVCAARAGQEDRAGWPNIVLILADDMGYGDPGCYNPQSKIPTPNIDRIAAQGMRFTDVHSPSSVCTPTRYGILTGRYCWRTRLKRGVLQGYDRALIEPGRPTIASVLKARGYATGCFGKWHLGFGDAQPLDYAKPLRPGPLTVGFETFFGIPSSLDFPPYVFVEDDRPVEQPTAQIGASESQREGGAGFWRAGAIAPGFRHEDVLPRITEKALAFLRRQSAAKPFFMYFPLTAPHTPWLATAPFRGKSGAGSYGDFAAQVDATVGQVLKVLDDKGLARNTLLIYTSDNGGHWLPSDIEKWGHRSNIGLRGQKADAYEGGHRVPFIARWPGRVRAGSTSAETLCLTDFFATFASAVGAEVPQGSAEDSFSFLPVLLGRKLEKPVREAVVHHSGDGLFALRSGDWKLIEGLGSGGFTPPRTEPPQPGGPEGQLYNLAEDPQETRNLWQRRPEVVARLKATLDRTRMEEGRGPRGEGRGKEEARAAGHPGGRRLNVLFLFADDQRADTIGAWGNPHIRTPNLDRLAGKGFSFRRNYCFGSNSGAVCVPSRAMLMSGRTWLNVDNQLGGVKLLPELLGERGYTTFATGKWHNGQPSFLRAFQQGRNVFFGGMSDHTKVPVQDVSPDHKLVNSRVGEKFSSELFADTVIDFLKGHRSGRPFFAYAAFTAPHDPRQPPPAYQEAYYRKRPPLPANFLPQHPFDNGQLVLRDENLAAWPRTRDVVSDQLCEYYGSITHLDEQIGRVLQALRESGHADDTLVVYAADHGLALGSHGLLGKQSVYEHSMRAPLIVAGPGVPHGESRAMTYLLDLYPTLCDFLAVEAPSGLEGSSLRPIWQGRARKVRDSVFLPFQNLMRAVSDGRWKLIRYPQIDHAQLFDLESDPDEVRSLADRPGQKERIERLTALMAEWQRRVGDTQPLSVDNPKPKHVDLTGTKRVPDQWQPEWIRKKYFD